MTNRRNGTDRNDWIWGSWRNDNIHGRDGNDYIFGNWGNDRIWGDAGNDWLFGGFGNDRLFGGTGNDRLYGGFGSDILDGGAGSDRLYGDFGDDRLIFKASENVSGANDYYDGGWGFDKLDIRLTGAEYNEDVRADLLAFQDWIDARMHRGYVRSGTFHFTTLNLSVSGIEKLILRVDGEKVDPTVPINTDVTEAENDEFSVEENAVLNASVTANDSPATGGTITLVSGVSNGILTLNGEGSFSFDASAFDYLAAGETATETFTYRLDANGSTDTATVTLNITGTNDIAVVSIDGGSDLAVIEDQDGISSGSLTVSDPDSGEARLDVAATTAALYGQFTVDETGVWSYALDQDNSAVQALGEGETLQDSITVFSADGSGSATLDIVITGTNDIATIALDAGADLAVTEDFDSVASGNVTVIDVDTGEAQVGPTSASAATYGIFSIDPNGAWTYSLDQTNTVVQALVEGETLQDSITVFSSDGSASATLDIVITGTNDVATIEFTPGADFDVAEDQDAVASGQLLVIDPDSGEAGVDPSSASSASYGSFAIDAAGNWTYELDNNLFSVQALGAGAVLTDLITVDSIDGTATASILVMIAGTNDAPQLIAALGPQQAKAGEAFSLTAEEGNFSDIDAGDVLTLSAALEGGAALPGWLSFNPVTGLFSGTPAVADAGSFAIALTATDTAGDTAVDLLTFEVSPGDPPAVATLRLSAVDGDGAGNTSAASVTLVGVADAGDRVNLFTEDGLTQLGTTIANNEGQFRFTGISLNLGSNAFEVESVDSQTGLSSRSDDQVFVRLDDAGEPINAALYWTQVTLDAIAASGASPNYASRAMAMESQAVFNVIAAIEGTPGYEFNIDAPEGASVEAAIAQAAYAVLAQLFPSQRVALNEALDARLAGITDGLTDGLDLGVTVAQRILEIRSDDGWNAVVNDTGRDEDGVWRPTGPGFRPGADAQWGDVVPFVVNDVENFRPDAPPSILTDTITDDEYASDYERTIALGRAGSTSRTADQSEIARFWQDGVGTETPAGHWTSIAAQIADGEGLSLSETANLMLQLNLAMADAGIAAFDTKYAYDVWRPLTVAQEGGSVDGTDLAPLVGWQPFVNTPNHPEYVSGHSTYSAAGAAVLTHFFGENYAFTTTSESIANPTFRSFNSFWEAADEAGASRIYGGIHWEFSNAAGKDLGQSIANAVIEAFDTTDDVIAPRVFINQEGGDALQSAIFNGFVIDNLTGVDVFRVSIDGGDYLQVELDANGNFSVDSGLATDGSADGVHDFQFIVTDLAGNFSIKTFEFVVAAGAPDIEVSGDLVTGNVDAETRLTGAVDIAGGTRLASLHYSINGGESLTIAFKSSSGEARFDQMLGIGDLLAGDHTLEITAVDLFGNSAIESFDFSIDADPLLTITNLTPTAGEAAVALTFRPLIEFSTAVDITTLNPTNIFATDTAGRTLAMTIKPLDDGTGAWLFFDDPLPGSSAITLTVDGDAITTLDGRALDGDGDGVAGGDLVQHFTTLADTTVPGTSIVGRILDPGADYQPMTPDDYLAGPDGATDWDGHTYLNPLANVKVFILGREDEAVYTDENGYFELTNVPGGSIKVAVDGRTATNAADGFFFPEMVMGVNITPGVENTIMASMGSREGKLANIGNEAVYLPRVDENILVNIDDNGVTTVKALNENGSVLTSEQLDLISIDVVGGSLLDENGDVILGAQVGISTVPPDLVRDMLPAGILQHTFDITIQAPAGAVFTEEAQITFPNVFNMAPGEQTFILSFDHTTGQLVIDGTATVSADGLTLVSDPGSGIDQPGWHGFTPPGFRVGGYGPNGPCLPADGSHRGPSAADNVEFINQMNGWYGNVGKITDKLGAVPFEAPANLSNFDKLGAALGLVEANDKIGKVMTDIANGYYANDTGSLGGDADAGFYGIKALELTGLVADAAYVTGSNLMRATGVAKNPGIAKTLDGIDSVRDGVALFNDTINNVDANVEDGIPGVKYAKKVQEYIDSPPPPKPAPIAPGSPPTESEQEDNLQELQDAKQDFDDAVQRLKDRAEQLKPHVEKLGEAAETLRDLLTETEGENAGELISLDDIVDLINFNPVVGDIGIATSEIVDAVTDMLDASLAINDIGSLVESYNEVAYYYEVLVLIYSEFVSDERPDFGDDATGADGGATDHYEYHHTLYGAAVDIETGEIIRFSFASGEQWDIILEPGKTYEIYFLDPASGYVSASLLNTGIAGGSNIPNSVGAGGMKAPVLLPDNSEIQLNGLTEIQSLIVGANPNIVDSLLPGTGISDLEALLSGTADTPLILNQSGPIASIDLLGEANAVALSGGGNNGAGLLAFVATGDYGFAIVDVSNPQNPVILNQIDLAGTATSIVASDDGRTVAIGLGAEGVVVYDTSNPLAVELSYSIDAPNALVELVGDTLVVADGSALSFYDFGSGAATVAPLELPPVGAFAAGNVEAIHWDGDRLIVVTDNNRVHLLSEDSGTFTVRGNVAINPIGSQKEAIAVDGDVAILGATGGFTSIDISNIDAPVIIDGPSIASSIGSAAIAVNGSGRGVAVGSLFAAPNSATVINSRTGNDEDAFVTSFALNGAPTDIEIAGRMAFVTTGTGGLQVVAYGAVDTAGIAPTISIDSQPQDIDSVTPGIQLLEGSLADFRVTVADDVLVRSVQLLVNGVVVDSDITYNWSLASFLPTIAGNGDDSNITIELRAVDTGGNIGTTGVIDVELVSDTTPFEIVAIRPADGAALAEGRNYVSIEFSKALDPTFAAFDRFTLTGPNGTVATPVAMQLFDNDTQIRLAFDLPSVEAGNYTFAIDTDSLFDRFGNALGDTPIVVNYVASDATATWISPIGGDWSNAANWADGTVPDADDIVLVSSVDGTSAQVLTNVGIISSLEVGGPGTLIVQPTIENGSLLATGTLFNHGNILIGSTGNKAGNLDVTGLLTNTTTISTRGFGNLSAAGDIMNSGILDIGSSSPTNNVGLDGLYMSAMDATLYGGGTLQFSNDAKLRGGQSTISFGEITHVLTVTDQTITGSGALLNASIVLDSSSSFYAEEGNFLQLGGGQVVNNTTLEAKSGGTLYLHSETFYYGGGIFAFRGPSYIDNVDGRIEANGGAVRLSDSTINGGYLGTTNVGGRTGIILLETSTLNGQSNPITLDGYFIGNERARAYGSLENTGFIELRPQSQFNGSEFEVTFDGLFTLYGSVTLTGGGRIQLSSGEGTDFDTGDPKNYYGVIDSDIAYQQYEEIVDPDTGEVYEGDILYTVGYTLTNVDNVITGSGWIGANPDPEEFGDGDYVDYRQVAEMSINNEVGGSIIAENGDTLTINHATVYNEGLIEARNGGTLVGTQQTFIFNDGAMNVFGGNIDLGAYTSNNGTVLIVAGNINFGSLFDNSGTVSITAGGSADMMSLVRNGGLIDIYGGSLNLFNTTTQQIEVGGGAADIRFGIREFFSSSTVGSLDGFLSNFGSDDSLTFDILDFAEGVTLNYFGGATGGILRLTDGTDTVELNLGYVNATGLGDLNAESHFFLTESATGGTILTTDLLTSQAGQSAGQQSFSAGFTQSLERVDPFADVSTLGDNGNRAEQITIEEDGASITQERITRDDLQLFFDKPIARIDLDGNEGILVSDGGDDTMEFSFDEDDDLSDFGAVSADVFISENTDPKLDPSMFYDAPMPEQLVPEPVI